MRIKNIKMENNSILQLSSTTVFKKKGNLMERDIATLPQQQQPQIVQFIEQQKNKKFNTETEKGLRCCKSTI